MATIASLERYIGTGRVLSGYCLRATDISYALCATLTLAKYLHEGWMRIASPEKIHQELRRAHQVSFESVLQLSVIELGRQLRFHFQSIGQPEGKISLLWLEAEPFRHSDTA